MWPDNRGRKRKIKVDSQEAEIVTAASGTVRYDWAAGETNTAGKYLFEWEITDADGNIQTVPTSGYSKLEIYQEIA